MTTTLFASLVLLASARLSTAAPLADPPEPAVDVHVAPTAPPWRRVAIEWNPLPFVTELGKVSADVVFVPREHHALVIAPFVSYTTTAPIFSYDNAGNAMQLPQQDFLGLGLEIGYRHYWGDRGPRGLFVGPSLILADIREHQGMFGNGSHTDYDDLGLAFDVGYQLLVTDAITVSAGLGVQGLITTRSIPQQQFPADIYANAGVMPRVLLGVGYAF